MFTLDDLVRLRDILTSSATSAKGNTYTFLDGWQVEECSFAEGGNNQTVINVILSGEDRSLKIRADYDRMKLANPPAGMEMLALLSTLIQESAATSPASGDDWIDLEPN